MRTAELLETVPGLVVTQHSGDGKANQYFLRGFNLDHGTDLATSVDGIPVNMHTHGHGQGYTDINFVIPELLERIEYKKGTYFADEGNFSAAGAVDLIYRRKLDDTLLSLTVGEDSYLRGLFSGSSGVGGGDLLWALDYGSTDGPWDLEEDLQRVNALLKYSAGEAGDGYSITASAYDGSWTSTDQIPERAVQSGALDRFGFIDPTDGGESHRYSLNFELEKPLGDWNFTGNVYALDYQLDLFSNFTYFLDTDNGDQFEQFDERQAYGLHAELVRATNYGGIAGQLMFGVESRYEDIGRVGLYLTDDRVRYDTIREDAVTRLGLGFFVEQQLQVTDWLRVIAGLRHDRADFDVDSDLAANSGSANDHITSPKFSMVFGPWAETEFFINAGRGFHENDARGTTITVDPVDGITAAEPVRPMVRASGAEIGMRTGFAAVHATGAHGLDSGSRLRADLRRRRRRHRGEPRHRAARRRARRLRHAHRLADARCGPRLVARALQRARPGGQLHSRRGGKRRVGGRGRAASRRLVRRCALPALRRGASHRRQQRAIGPDDGGQPRSRAPHRRAFLPGARGVQRLRFERQRHHIFLREPAGG